MEEVGWSTIPTSAEGKMKWGTKQVRVQGGVEDDQRNLCAALGDGWEPFAVTGVRGDYTYHLKIRLYWVDQAYQMMTNRV